MPCFYEEIADWQVAVGFVAQTSNSKQQREGLKERDREGKLAAAQTHPSSSSSVGT
jgi:hypothetical protein